jgi:hypothetical protein
MAEARGWGAHASPRAISGVPPENLVRRDAEHHTRGRVSSPDPSTLPPFRKFISAFTLGVKLTIFWKRFGHRSMVSDAPNPRAAKPVRPAVLSASVDFFRLWLVLDAGAAKDVSRVVRLHLQPVCISSGDDAVVALHVCLPRRAGVVCYGCDYDSRCATRQVPTLQRKRDGACATAIVGPNRWS